MRVFTTFILAMVLAGLNRGLVIGKPSNCQKVNVLTYHHIQPIERAQDEGELNLTVTPKDFIGQVNELRAKGYTLIDMAKIAQAVDAGKELPSNPVLLTFDDGYEDMYRYLFPIVRSNKIPVAIFLITGLIDVPGYLSWEQIEEMAKTGLVYFGNHTWSHAYENNRPKYQKEIEISERQLWEKGLNDQFAFAYPYGSYSNLKQEVLIEGGIRLAFTTEWGNQICQNHLLTIPRIRMEGGEIRKFGL